MRPRHSRNGTGKLLVLQEILKSERTSLTVHPVQRSDDSLPPLPPIDPPPNPTLAPAWLALLTAWLGLLLVVASIVFIFLPGSRDPRAELEHLQKYSLADRFLPLPIYGIAFVLFLGVVVLWQMRKESRPLPEALVAQRLQAWAGIALSLLAAAIIYVHVALRGPR